MLIKIIDLQNFRKLKCTRIKFSDKKTLFVGANNSGKTSAMDALIKFIKNKNFSFNDFTVANWDKINAFGFRVIDEDSENPTREEWREVSPILDIWIDLSFDEIRIDSKELIPHLEWNGGLIGFRYCFEPDDLEKLYGEYAKDYELSNELKIDNGGKNFKIWPKNLKEFLEKHLNDFFKINIYRLNPEKLDENEETPKIQALGENSVHLSNPLKNLIKIEIIKAQRGFSDMENSVKSNIPGKLSYQLRSYYDDHINHSDVIDSKDVAVLKEIENAQNNFDEKLQEGFKNAISELENLGYPGFDNPKIKLSTKIEPLAGFDHDAAVNFMIQDSENQYNLPEGYNGLGYQNLISMVFELIRFRDDWLQTGKLKQKRIKEEKPIEPLLLILIEEPEAYLHAQIQQVFIKKVYQILEKNKPDKNFNVQMVVSTHSSYIVHEEEYSNLRYFRKKSLDKNNIPLSSVINLSNVFGDETKTSKFKSRYLRTTHCDLFFADAIILIEGTAERMMLPHFIKKDFPKLNQSYISFLEIGGSHAHKLKDLIELLGIYTLIITDLDSVDPKTKKSHPPFKNEKLETNNSTLKDWIPKNKKIDALLSFKEEKLISKRHSFLRVAYQKVVSIHKKEVIPRTYEDSLFFDNYDFFKDSEGDGLLKKFSDNAKDFEKDKDSNKLMENVHETLKSADKAKFALDILFEEDFENLRTPDYIFEGLTWLKNSLE
jgi:predicted ATP-dependent endonuclease of OLD family